MSSNVSDVPEPSSGRAEVAEQWHCGVVFVRDASADADESHVPEQLWAKRLGGNSPAAPVAGDAARMPKVITL
jgi:hypothetical protein